MYVGVEDDARACVMSLVKAEQSHHCCKYHLECIASIPLPLTLSSQRHSEKQHVILLAPTTPRRKTFLRIPRMRADVFNSVCRATKPCTTYWMRTPRCCAVRRVQ